MEKDYKIAYIKQDSQGKIMEAKVRFYEGDISAKAEDVRGEKKIITRYRRSVLLEEKIYSSKDFGEINDEKDLLAFINNELAMNYVTRIPIKEQSIPFL